MSKGAKTDVVIVGAGYVGLTLALHMVLNSLSVLAVDVDERKVSGLERGESVIFERGITEALQRCVATRRLRFSTACSDGAPAWIIAVTYLPGEAEGFLAGLDGIRGRDGEPPLVMIRGTVPVGYTRTHILPRLERHLSGALDEAFHLVAAPERTLSGAALEELSSLPQLVGGSAKSVERARRFLEAANIRCISLPSLEAAEIAKTFTNFARLVQFNVANFLGILCHRWNLSEQMLIAAMTAGYPRLGFLSDPGPGVGGFCLPKDCLILHDGLRGIEGPSVLAERLVDYPYQEHALNEEIIRFHGDRVLDLVARARRATRGPVPA